MHEIDEDKLGFSTKAIHCGTEGKHSTHGPVNTPIYASSTFAYPSVEAGADIFSGENPDGYVYSRLGNPTVRDVECRLALLEGAEDAVCVASGMAAVSTTIFSILKQGDHMIADHTLYGCSHSFFTHNLPDLGIEVTFLDTSNLDDVRLAIKSNTKLIFFETPTNPTLRIVPVEEIARIGKEFGILTAIDSTFMSPVLMRPIEMGIDIVIHSATKYLNGHSDIIAGVILGRKEFIDECRGTVMHYGGVLGPFEAYLLGRGLKTLKIRMDVHETNTRKVAEYLANHPGVKMLNYLGLESHPQHELARKQQDGFGSMLTFEINGDFEETKHFVNCLKIATRAVSLGGVETLISHPASTTHAVIDEVDRMKAGITDGLMRVSIGIEEPEDIIADFDQAFTKLKAYQQTQIH
ncbi:MAG: trans-sulfuration enzyme family protein [Candidatus Kariarchaeaceae archaeon]|jgi:methionine-gamma-lyase